MRAGKSCIKDTGDFLEKLMLILWTYTLVFPDDAGIQALYEK